MHCSDAGRQKARRLCQNHDMHQYDFDSKLLIFYAGDRLLLFKFGNLMTRVMHRAIFHGRLAAHRRTQDVLP